MKNINDNHDDDGKTNYKNLNMFKPIKYKLRAEILVKILAEIKRMTERLWLFSVWLNSSKWINRELADCLILCCSSADMIYKGRLMRHIFV